MDQFFTYILFSEKLNKYYIGSTSDLVRRIEEHNRGKSKFTKTGIPWKLAYYEEHSSRVLAVDREMYIKKRKSRSFIESLIAQQV